MLFRSECLEQWHTGWRRVAMAHVRRGYTEANAWEDIRSSLLEDAGNSGICALCLQAHMEHAGQLFVSGTLEVEEELVHDLVCQYLTVA